LSKLRLLREERNRQREKKMPRPKNESIGDEIPQFKNSSDVDRKQSERKEVKETGKDGLHFGNLMSKFCDLVPKLCFFPPIFCKIR